MTSGEIRTFVGDEKASFYRRKWRPLLANSLMTTSWNWSAFFLAHYWIAYRKMYPHLAVLLIMWVLADFLTAEWELFCFFALILHIICGAYGNFWYFKHAESVISEVRGENIPDEKKSEEISKRGGTNITVALILLVALTLFSIPYLFSFGIGSFTINF